MSRAGGPSAARDFTSRGPRDGSAGSRGPDFRSGDRAASFAQRYASGGNRDQSQRFRTGDSGRQFAARPGSGSGDFRGRGDSRGPSDRTGDFRRPSGDFRSGDFRPERVAQSRSQFLNRYGKSGDWNRGDWNRGDRGDWNRGDWSRGDWNRGQWKGRPPGDWHGGDPWRHRGWNRYAGWHGGGPWWGPRFGWYGGGWGWPLWWVLGTQVFGAPSFAYSTFGYPHYGVYDYPVASYYDFSYAETSPYYMEYAAQQPIVVDQTADTTAAPATTTEALPPPTTNADFDFAYDGELKFQAGDYDGAIYAWRHALIDDPMNSTLILMLSQAFFAAGNYSEAAGAVQAAMAQLPPEEWGVVVTNYADLYNDIGQYTTQLRALEAQAKQTPDNPALQFLLGYHYNYLGYPQQAEQRLARTVELAPQDIAAKLLLDVSQGKEPTMPDVDRQPAAPATAAPQGAAPGETPPPTLQQEAPPAAASGSSDSEASPDSAGASPAEPASEAQANR